jgi:hypothetical protein
MGTGATFANDLLQLVFNAVNITHIADNAASAPFTTFYIGLHTADPTNGDQTTNEIATYSTYVREPVARTAGGWAISGQQLSPVDDIVFPVAASGDSGTVPYWSIGTAVSGTGLLLFAGTISPTIMVVQGHPPKITAASTLTLT